MVVRKMLFTVMILASLLMMTVAQAQPSHPEWEQVSGADVRRIVSGIISYSHWPDLNQPPVLCVYSSAHFLTALTAPAGVQEKVVFNTLIIKDNQELFASECDAVYFGEESVAEQINAASYAIGHPLMTIAEQSPRCLEGSAFCLVFDTHTVGFAINMEALSRTGVRVNPDVLMLARERN